MVERGIDGEMRIPDRWTNCVVCGVRTNQPPVCHDLRCEMELER